MDILEASSIFMAVIGTEIIFVGGFGVVLMMYIIIGRH